MYSFVDGGVALDLRKTQKLPQIVSDGKRSLSIIHVHCRLCIQLVNVEPYTVNSASFSQIQMQFTKIPVFIKIYHDFLYRVSRYK